jgi:hypothetical protein
MEGLSSRPRLTSLTLIKNSCISRALIPGTWCSHRRQWVADFDHSPVELRRPIAAESGLQNAMQPDWIPSVRSIPIDNASERICLTCYQTGL